MSLKEQYDTLDRLAATAPHRVPRCPKCRLVLPCRIDGRYGECDAREVTNESYNRTCDLIRAIMSVSEEEAAKEAAKEVTTGRSWRRTAEKDTALARAKADYLARAEKAGRKIQTHCKNGHEQTGDNVYECLRGGWYRTLCAPCLKARYAAERMEKQNGTTGIPGSVCGVV